MGDLEAAMATALSDARASGAIVDDAPVVETPEVDETPVVDDIAVDDDGTTVITPGEEDEPVVEKPVVDATTLKPVKDVKPPVAEEIEVDGTDPEVLKKMAGADNRIPHKEVGRIAATREKKTLLAVATKLGIPGIDAKSYNAATIHTALDSMAAELTEARSERDHKSKVEPIMRNDPDEFLARLVGVNPDYANFVRKGTETAAAAPVVDDASDPRPAPDYDLGNGKRTYSDEGFQKLLDWHERRGERRAQAVAKKELDTRFKPIEDERSAKQKTEAERENLMGYMAHTIKEAKTWKGFAEHEAEIREAVTNGPYKDLPFAQGISKAYQDIVIGKLVLSHDEMYARVLAEFKKQTSPTSITPGVPVPKVEEREEQAEDGEDQTTKNMRAALRQARAKGRIK